MEQKNTLSIFTDGGSRGNPGAAAIGVYIIDSTSKPIYTLGKRIGTATNNVAEYTAVLCALEWIKKNVNTFTPPLHIQFFLDSLLIVSQVKGLWKVKDQNLQQLVHEVKEKQKSIQATFSYTHIPREKNKQADKLVNMALDNLL